jgi:hypothetical protein
LWLEWSSHARRFEKCLSRGLSPFRDDAGVDRIFLSFFKLIDRHKLAVNKKSEIACFLLYVLEMAEFIKRGERMLP